MRIRDGICLSSIAFVVAACASSSAPRAYLVDAVAEQTDAFGGWIEVEFAGEGRPELQGELIAVEGDSIFVLPTSNDLVGFESGAVEKMQLRGYNPEAGGLAGWTTLGAVSTLSHGVVLVFTFPAWLLVGTASTATQSRAADIHYPGADVSELRAWARFPAGLPRGLDRSELRLRSRPLGRSERGVSDRR